MDLILGYSLIVLGTTVLEYNKLLCYFESVRLHCKTLKSLIIHVAVIFFVFLFKGSFQSYDPMIVKPIISSHLQVSNCDKVILPLLWCFDSLFECIKCTSEFNYTVVIFCPIIYWDQGKAIPKVVSID